MPIEVIFRETQPKEYSKLNKKFKRKSPLKKKYTEEEIKELMYHSSYERKGRAIRQVK